MSKYEFVTIDEKRYRIRQSENLVFKYVVAVWNRLGWKIAKKEEARKVLMHVGYLQ